MFVIYFLISVGLRIFIGVEKLFRKKFCLVKKKVVPLQTQIVPVLTLGSMPTL